jgi:DNA-binding response OmpR family regulator/cell division protein FtsN
MKEKTILVLDSDNETLLRVMNPLQAERYRVLTAPSLDAGISLARQEKPLLLFFSLRMAGTRGLEIFKNIHETQGLENIPIVILTSRDVTITARDTSLYGIVDYLKMSFSASELIQKTQDVLSRYLIPDEPVIEEKTEHAAVNISEEKQAVTSQTVEEPDVQPDEEPVSVQPAGTEPVEGSTGGQEETPDLWLEEEPALDVSRKTGDEDVSKGAAEEDGKPYVPKDEEHHGTPLRTGQGKKYVFPVLVLAILIVAGGYIFFTHFWQKSGFQKQAGLKPSVPYQQPAHKTSDEKPIQQQQEGMKSVPPQTNQKPETGEQKQQVPLKEMQKPQAAGQVKSVSAPFPQNEKNKQSKLLYAVQIGGFKNETNALSLMNTYKTKGYDARLQKTSSQGKGLFFKVLIGAYEKRSEAQQMANAIRSKEKIQGFVVKE